MLVISRLPENPLDSQEGLYSMTAVAIQTRRHQNVVLGKTEFSVLPLCNVSSWRGEEH